MVVRRGNRRRWEIVACWQYILAGCLSFELAWASWEDILSLTPIYLDFV